MSRKNHANQVSIYNYPEHLNPFYEDEQHKRLRFWKIGNSKNRYPEQRRDSFNLGSLKDLFALKSFRLKKKSSTLGINKTSESPPQLRRGGNNGYSSEDESRYATFDQRFDPNSESGFLRSARYRSSLQNMNNFSCENRNEPFRRTMQGSILSKNRENQHNKSHYLASPNGMTPGSSMNSISTNPFDDDTDNDSIAAASVTNSKRIRKKRRAPLPPLKTKMEPSVEAENGELRIDESTETLNRLEELTRMTADFETFVKRSKSDTDEKSVLSENIKSIQIDEQFPNNEVITPEILHEMEYEKKTKETVERQESEDLNELKYRQVENVSREVTPDYIPVPVREKFQVLRIDEDELIDKSNHINSELNACQQNILSIQQSNEKTLSSLCDSIEPNERAVIKTGTVIIQKDSSINHSKNASSAPKTNHHIFMASNQIVEENRVEISNSEIIETTEKELLTSDAKDVPSSYNSSFQANEKIYEREPMMVSNSHKEKPAHEASVHVYNSEIEEKLTVQGFSRVENPIKFYDDIETFLRKKEHQLDHDDFNQNEPPIPPVRRRSVKDIIESINRSQQLLRVSAPQFERKFDYDGQKLRHNKPVIPPKDKVLLKLSRQVENEKRVNELLADLQNFNTNEILIPNNSLEEFNVPTDGNNNPIGGDNSQMPGKGEINPVPKPRRVAENC